MLGEGRQLTESLVLNGLGPWEPDKCVAESGGHHRGAGMEGSATVTAEDTVAGERCPLVRRDDKTPWGQPRPAAGSLLGAAKDHSLWDHFPHSGAQASESTHDRIGGWGGRGSAEMGRGTITLCQHPEPSTGSQAWELPSYRSS